MEDLEGALRPRPVRIARRPPQTEVGQARNRKLSLSLAQLHFCQLYNKKQVLGYADLLSAVGMSVALLIPPVEWLFNVFLGSSHNNVMQFLSTFLVCLCIPSLPAQGPVF